MYFLFYLLLLFLPLQLGRHFFFDFTLISGIRSDYLTPTIYLTDIIILGFLTVSSWSFWGRVKQGLQNLRISGFWTSQNDKKYFILLSFIFYLLFNSFFIAANKWAALYKLAKIIEFALLGYAISKLKPKFKSVVTVLSVSVFYSSVLAIWQFLLQRSVGGVFWFLGERTFNSGTPGIAAISLPTGSLILRPYATFPHPNVLGGFLALILPVILFFTLTYWKKNHRLLHLWCIASVGLGVVALILTFSRLAYLTITLALLVFVAERRFRLSQWLNKRKNFVLGVIYFLIISSVVVPNALPDSIVGNYQNWQERVALIKTTIDIILRNPIFGIGLNNFIVQSQNYTSGFPGLYIYQPVHNIYLLILAETGITGLFFFLLFLVFIFKKIKNRRTIFIYSLIQLFVLGLFDHYLFTLQQGQLLLTVLVAFSLMTKNSKRP